MITIMADGQSIQFEKTGPVMVLIPPTDMVVEAPDYVKVGPEETVKCSNEIEQDQWELIRVHPAFAKAWGLIMKDVEPPVVLAKSSLGVRHIAGLFLMAVLHKDKKLFFELPETYLHPQQLAWLMMYISHITGQKKG